MTNNNRLTPLEKIGYGLGDFASNVVFQSILILLPVFYTDVFGLEPAVMGTLFLVVRALDAIIDPAMGIIADHTDTRWGKYRPYLLWFAVPFALMMVLTYTTPSFGPTGKIVYASITYGLLMVLYTMVNIPYCALGGVISALAAAGAHLHEISKSEPTLEEVFVQLVGRGFGESDGESAS